MRDTKEIRKRLKAELGYNARQVSVKLDTYPMGASLYFTIRDPAVNFAKVERFAASCETVHRCEISGDILSGGNTYVHVEVTDEVRDALAWPLVLDVAATFAKMEAERKEREADGSRCNGFGLPVGSADLLLWSGDWPGEFYLTRRSDPNGWRGCRYTGNPAGLVRAASGAVMDHGRAVLKYKEPAVA